jgi:hypothetical protein
MVGADPRRQGPDRHRTPRLMGAKLSVDRFTLAGFAPGPGSL